MLAFSFQDLGFLFKPKKVIEVWVCTSGLEFYMEHPDSRVSLKNYLCVFSLQQLASHHSKGYVDGASTQNGLTPLRGAHHLPCHPRNSRKEAGKSGFLHKKLYKTGYSVLSVLQAIPLLFTFVHLRPLTSVHLRPPTSYFCGPEHQNGGKVSDPKKDDDSNHCPTRYILRHVN